MDKSENYIREILRKSLKLIKTFKQKIMKKDYGLDRFYQKHKICNKKLSILNNHTKNGLMSQINSIQIS